jgi:hypothetical protein
LTISAAKHDNKWYKREASAYGRRHFGEEWWTPWVKTANPTKGFLGYKE